MTTSCTDTNHPYYNEISKIDSGKVASFFLGDYIHRMKYVSLGELLDFTSCGALNFVVWPNLNRKGLIDLIKTWMDNQEPRVKYERIPDPKIKGAHTIKEKSREVNYVWNRFNHDFSEQLPFINKSECPKHNGTITDLAGRKRCAHVDIQTFKPSFIKSFPRNNQNERIQYYEEDPALLPDLSEDDEEDLRKKYLDEQRSVSVINPCYSVISDVGINLPLEAVLSRVDISHKFTSGRDFCVYPFSGFTLASYVKAWWEQTGEKRFFLPEGVVEPYKVWPDFQPVGSDD